MKNKIYPIVLLLTIAVPAIPVLLFLWLKHKVDTDYFAYVDSPLLSTLGTYNLLTWVRAPLFTIAVIGMLVSIYFHGKTPSLTGKIFIALQIVLAICVGAIYFYYHIAPLFIHRY